MITKTTKRTKNGRLAGNPLSQLIDTAYLVERAPATPMKMPPRKVRGRLEKYPMAAAPKACTTSIVMTSASRLREGASNRPAIDAKTIPMIQAQRRTRTGFSPVIDTRSGLSTTPRMAAPRRTWRKK